MINGLVVEFRENFGIPDKLWTDRPSSSSLVLVVLDYLGQLKVGSKRIVSLSKVSGVLYTIWIECSTLVSKNNSLFNFSAQVGT